MLKVDSYGYKTKKKNHNLPETCLDYVTGRFGTGWQKCVIFLIFILFPPLKCLKSAFFLSGAPG